MLSGLILTAFLMGVGGMPHCAAMCGAACAAALPKGLPLPSLLGRCVGYAILGALAAASAGTVAQWGRQVSFLQPLWVMLQAAAVMLGLYLVWRGRMPSQLDESGQRFYRHLQARWARSPWGMRQASFQRLLPFVAGMAWAALPCGLLYAAVMVATLAPDAWGGALVMLAFALPSAVGVWAAPALLRWIAAFHRRHDTRPGRAPAAGVAAIDAGGTLAVPVIWMQQPATKGKGRVCATSVTAPTRWPDAVGASWVDPRWALRLSGAMLAAMAGWALYHQLLHQWAAWCA